MPNPVPATADLLLQYPKAPFPATDAQGKPTSIYLQWANGIATLKLAAAMESLDRKSPNPDSSI